MKTDFRNEFSWSKSRDEIFLECARRYYFHYYGAWGGWERDCPPRTRLLYQLKHLKTRQLWAGGKTHDAIEQLLIEVRDSLAIPSEEEILQRVLTSMRKDFKDSREGRYRDDPKRRVGLFEHAYELEVPDAVWKQTADHVTQCLRTFYASDTFAAIRALPRDQWLEVEKLSTLSVDGIKVYVKLDFSCRQEEAVHIYDWKTGRSEGADHTLQMACYGLYATTTWGVEPEQVTVFEYNLAGDTVRPHGLAQEAMEETRDHILASAGEMRIFLDDEASNQATEENFPVAEDEQVCRRCPFLKACPKWAG